MGLTHTAIFGVVLAVALAATLAVLPITKAVRIASPPDEGTSVAIKQEKAAINKTIRTIPISPVPPQQIAAPLVLPAPVVQQAAPEPAPAPPVARRFPVEHGDICAAHHCVKITSGRGWHCKCGQR